MQIFTKEPIYLNEFESEDNFNLLEAKSNWVAFRNEVSMHIMPSETRLRATVDLIFVEAMFIEIPTHFSGIRIVKPKDNLSIQLSQKYDKGNDFLEAGERAYAIESDGERYNIVASNLWIHVHNQQFRGSPFDFIYFEGLEKYNYYLENYVQQWIKIK